MERKGINEKAINIKTGKVIVDLDKKYLRPSEVDFLRGNFSKAKNISIGNHKFLPKI